MAIRNNNDWNAFEKFDAILPVIEPLLKVHYRRLTELPSDGLLSELSNDALSIASQRAREVDATPEQIQRWVSAFTSFGKPGLSAEIALEAEACVENVQGTWELTTRFSGGERAASRGQILYDTDPANLRGLQLITMITEENHLRREDHVGQLRTPKLGQQGVGVADPGDSTMLMTAFVEFKMEQKSAYEVELTTTGEMLGNFGHYEAGKKISDRATLVRFEQTEAMLGIPDAWWVDDSGSADEQRTGGFLLVKAAGDAGSLVYHEQGFPPMLGSEERTIDVVDTYAHASGRRPLVGGWEPIKDYFERMKNPTQSVEAIRALGKEGATLHGFQTPLTQSRLRRFDEFGDGAYTTHDGKSIRYNGNARGYTQID